MMDPFTESDNVSTPVKISGHSFGSENVDSRRMDSLDNGMLLCLVHHCMMDNLWFTIHPDVSHQSETNADR